MAGKTVVSDDEEDVEVEDNEGEPLDEEDRRRHDDDEDEEDDEGQDEYEKDGFIVDDVDEEEQDEEEERADSDEERQKKKKRKKRESEKNFVLDEDDYELLEDNNITGFHRPKMESKRFKRLKKAQRDTRGEGSGFSDEEEFDGLGRVEGLLRRSLSGAYLVMMKHQLMILLKRNNLKRMGTLAKMMKWQTS